MSAVTHFDRLGTRGLVVDELDWALLSDHDRGLLRTVGYRDVLPVEGLQVGNTDLVTLYQQAPAPRTRPAPLPIYPEPCDLQQEPA